MKKLISVLMSIVILSGLFVPVSAQEENDGYAHGVYEYGGELVFESYVRINDLSNVEKLTICVDYNPQKIKDPKVNVPVYFNVEKQYADGEIILTVTEGNGVFENEYFYVTFDVLDKDLKEDDTGFAVSVKAEFRDGEVRELNIPVNVAIYLHLPVLQPVWKEIDTSCDKSIFVVGETVVFTTQCVQFPEAEKVKIIFSYNKNVFSMKEIIADETVAYATEETAGGYVVVYDCDEDINGSISVIFEVREKGEPVFFVNHRIITENGEEEVLYNNGNIPSNYVYEKSEIAKIVLSGRLELYRDGDTLYFPFAVTEKYFEGGIFSTVGRYGADLAYRFASAGYTDRPVVTGESIIAYADGTVSDSISICIIGDINCNGSVNATDARLALRHSAQIDTLDVKKADAADVDRNGVINAADARMILRVGAQIDTFALPEITVSKGEEFVISKLLNAGSGAYNWKCTVSDDSAFEVTDIIAPPEDIEIFPGTPFEQTFTFKALETGKYNVNFELVCSWEEKPADRFSFVINVE